MGRRPEPRAALPLVVATLAACAGTRQSTLAPSGDDGCTGPNHPIRLQASAPRQAGDKSPGGAAYLTGPAPEYPAALRLAGIPGHVKVSFVVGIDGRIEPCSLMLQEVTDSGFVASALATLRASKFRPATANGTAIRSVVSQTIGYRIGATGTTPRPFPLPLLSPPKGGPGS